MTDRNAAALLQQLQLSPAIGGARYCGLITLPDVFAGPSAGPRPAKAIRELIRALPSGGRLVVAGHPSTLRLARTWGEMQERTVEFVAVPTNVEFTMWSQDAFLACEDGEGSPLMLFPVRELRAADTRVAETIAATLAIRTIRTDFDFEGGNVLTGDSVVLAGADRASTPIGKASDDCLGGLAGSRRVTVLGTETPMPAREVHLIDTEDGAVIEERFGYAGVRQPLFHIDAFVTLAGRGSNRRERVLVGDLRLAARLIGRDQLPADHRLITDGLDEIADQLARDDRIQVIRNALPIIAMVHRGLRAWPRNKVASKLSGVAGIEDVLSEYDRRGLKTVPVRFWRAATQNSCLVFRNGDGNCKVIVPTFAHGSTGYLASSEEFNRRLWQSLGFDVAELPDFAPFAERNGSLHCMVKLIAPGVPRPERTG